MAEIAFVRSFEHGQTIRHVWTDIEQSDTATAAKIPGASDRSVQAKGTFGAGASIAFEVSLDSDAATASFDDTTDLQGTAIALGSKGVEFVTENGVWYKPVITGGDGSTAITVTLLSRRTR